MKHSLAILLLATLAFVLMVEAEPMPQGSIGAQGKKEVAASIGAGNMFGDPNADGQVADYGDESSSSSSSSEEEGGKKKKSKKNKKKKKKKSKKSDEDSDDESDEKEDD